MGDPESGRRSLDCEEPQVLPLGDPAERESACPRSLARVGLPGREGQRALRGPAGAGPAGAQGPPGSGRFRLAGAEGRYRSHRRWATGAKGGHGRHRSAGLQGIQGLAGPKGDKGDAGAGGLGDHIAVLCISPGNNVKYGGADGSLCDPGHDEELHVVIVGNAPPSNP